MVVGEGGSGGGAGVEDRCAICLDRISGEGYLDQCFHKFCYHCILQWSEMVVARPSSTSNHLQYLECPLCKTQYTSIIHDVFGSKFQRHYIFTSRSTGLLRSEAHIRRLAVYSSELGKSDRERYLSTHVARKPNRWLSCWVQRELQALMQEEDVDTVMHHILGIVESFSRRFGEKVLRTERQGDKAKDLSWHSTVSAAVRPFIFEFAERFAEELESFLVSGLDIAAYDQRNQQPTSVSEPLAEHSRANTLPLFDLYDEDIDEGWSHVVVRKTSSEIENPSSDESSETMKHHNREDDLQGLKSSQRESGNSRVKNDSIKSPFANSDGDSDRGRGRSRHRREVRKKRKVSISSSSRSSSPKHKQRKRHKSAKSHSSKKRKHSKKDKKVHHEHRRKSRKTSSRKFTDSSSDSDSSRSTRSQSRGKRAWNLKEKKRYAISTSKAVLEKPGRRKMARVDLEGTIKERRKSPRHYRSGDDQTRRRLDSSSPAGQSLHHIELAELSKDDSPWSQKGISTGMGDQDFKSNEKYLTELDDRSSAPTWLPDDGRDQSFHQISPRVQPGRSFSHAHAGSQSPPTLPRDNEVGARWDPTSRIQSQEAQRSKNSDEEGELPRSNEQTAGWESPSENQIPGGQRSDRPVDVIMLETKLREQALANLLRHLNQKKHCETSTESGNQEDTRVRAEAGQIGGISVQNGTRRIGSLWQVDSKVSEATKASSKESVKDNPAAEEELSKSSERTSATENQAHVASGCASADMNFTRLSKEDPASSSQLLQGSHIISTTTNSSGRTEEITCERKAHDFELGETLDVDEFHVKVEGRTNTCGKLIPQEEKLVAFTKHPIGGVVAGDVVEAIESHKSGNSPRVELHAQDSVLISGSGDQERRNPMTSHSDNLNFKDKGYHIVEDHIEDGEVVIQKGSKPSSTVGNQSSEVTVMMEESANTLRSPCSSNQMEPTSIGMEERFVPETKTFLDDRVQESISAEVSGVPGVKEGDSITPVQRTSEVMDVTLSVIPAVTPVNPADKAVKRDTPLEKAEPSLLDFHASKPDGSSKVPKDGSGDDSERFQQRSMSVTRGGESVQVRYKVYIPPRAAAAAAARRKLQR